MKTIFKGNNFAIVWNIIDSSTHTPFDFSGMKVEVGLYSECCKKAIKTYNISNGTIEFEVESEELQNGVYNLMCRYSTENEQAYCIYKRAFQITGKPEFASNVETIILESKASHIDATDHDDPIPDFENCQLIAQELFKENFRLPQLTAHRAIADEHGNRIADTYVSREAVTKHIRNTYNQQFLENPPLITEGYITPQMLSDETRQLLEESGATINNLPDGEDLQSVHGVLKLANKQHNPNSYSGLGRQYLRKNIVAGQNILTQSMLQWPNTIYIIQYDYDLNGAEITVPEGCVLDFQGGSLNNGILTSVNSLIVYNNPFIGKDAKIIGFRTNTVVNKDIDIFVSVDHTKDEIVQLFELSRFGVKTIFSKGEYFDVSEITINHDIDADFNGSILHVSDYGDEVNKNLMMMPYEDESENFVLDHFRLQNVEIIGSGINYYCVELITDKGKPQYSHPYAPCIQIFNVREVVFDNVNINNYVAGFKGSLDSDFRKRWNNHLVSLYWYDKCIINSCHLSWCVTEGYMLVPRTSTTNSTIITDCYCHDFYFTPFYISDGKITFQRNTIDRSACSMAALHGYDADISYNIFKNGTNNSHNCLTLEENGSHYSTNFNIHDNYFFGDFGAIRITGSDIKIHKNFYNGTNMFVRINSYNEYESAHNTNNRIPEDKRNKNILIYDNVVKGQWLVMASNTDNVKVFGNKSIILDASIRGVQIECGKTSDIAIQNNLFYNTGSNGMSTKKCFIKLDESGFDIGKAKITNNYFYGDGDEILGASYRAGIQLMANELIFTGNYSDVNRKMFDRINMLGVIPMCYKNNINIEFSGIVDKNDYGEDIQEIGLVEGMYYKKNQTLYVNDIKCICKKEGIYASNRENNNFYRRGSLFKSSDNSVHVCINEGKTSTTEPDYSTTLIGETTTDGALTVKKVSTECSIFKCDNSIIYPKEVTIPNDYLQEGVQKIGEGSKIVHWNGEKWVDASGTEV